MSDSFKNEPIAPPPQVHRVKLEWACLHCDTPIAKNKTGLCKACLVKRPYTLCSNCKAECRIRDNKLCNRCSPITNPAPPVEFMKDGVKLCCVTKHEVYGGGIQNDIFLCCQLSDEHEGRHSQQRYGVTHEWGRICGARNCNRPCILPEGHIQPHKIRLICGGWIKWGNEHDE